MILLKFEAMPNTFGTGFQHISNNQEKGAKKIKLRPKKEKKYVYKRCENIY